MSSKIKEVINHSQAQKNTISSDESDENFEGQSPHSSLSLENPKKSQKESIEILTAVSTPPHSGISSKSVPKEDNFNLQEKSIPQSQSQAQARSKVKNSTSIESMFETFHQSPSGEFKPTFYNPFEVKHRRRTSRSQVKILERAFMENCKPTALLRKNLARELNMSARSIQVWFQNRRAKLKSLMKNGKITEMQMSNFLLEHNQIQNGKQQSETEDEEEEENKSQESENEYSENKKESKKTNTNQQPIEQNIKIFQNERRTLPYSKRFSGSVNAGDSESMKLGNSYPNQVRNRSYSLPEIQRSPKLPFKQLQEAIFGPPYQESYPVIQGQVPLQQPHQTTIQAQTQQVPAPLTESSYYSSSLNAFQNYFRASNAALLQVQGNYYSQPNCNSNLTSSHSPTQLQLPQLNFPTLNQIPCEYQVDPNRFRRPRSSSFAVGHRTNSNYPQNKNECSDEEFSTRHPTLSVIKEDSPISNYMSLEDLTCNPGGFNGNVYFNGHDQDSTEISNQINSLDLDYFMSVHNQMNEFSMESSSASSNSSSLINSPSDSHNIHIYNNNPNHHPNHNIRPYSYQHQHLQPRHHNNNNVGNFMPEMAAFLPQPSNEILLSTLINDDHFLN